MLLLKTIVFDADKFYVESEIETILEYFKEKNITLNTIIETKGMKKMVTMTCLPENYNNRIISLTSLYVSNMLYRITAREYCNTKLIKYLNDAYGYLNLEDIADLKDKITDMIREDDDNINDIVIYYLNRKNAVVEEVASWLIDSEEINVEGFYTFKIKQIQKDFEKVVDKIIEEYIINKEYTEFIRLLKYLVDSQEFKCQRVDIIIGEKGQYTVVDETGDNVIDRLLSNLYQEKIDEEKKVSVDDLIVSSLITMAPAKVYIYGRENCTNLELLDIIAKVFEGRIIYRSNKLETIIKEKNIEKNLDFTK